MTPTIAIVGMACRYPDANSPQELWQNVLAQRTAFRKIPPERLSLGDYFSEDRQTPDATYAQNAALLRDYSFDRNRFRIVGSTYRSADPTHWLALDVAADALADAGYPDGAGLPKARSGVILGNTLTGEMARAQSLRLRWPYVRRTVRAQLHQQGMPAGEQAAFLSELEERYKAPFEPVGSETLAGNLANTIAGRICNVFDLNGGGYTVDGACSSSLLAITQACTQVLMGDLEVAIAGGVDISIDPFELVGFAKVGALTADRMLVYDQHSAGFIPGEGCGMVVLMNHEAAIAQQKRIYAVIQGWGISSDGQGGITRPEVEGQKLALLNTYRRAPWTIQSVGYFEGHGTGTVVGDATELQALQESLSHEGPPPERAAIGSIKANIGHTKAAAGIAGLIKATLALHQQVLPPTSACPNPQERLNGPQPSLQVLPQGKVWPANLPLRAAVSAMGFGGINTHIALENPTQLRRTSLSSREQTLLASHQDVELLLFSAASGEALLDQITALLPWLERLSRAELGDLAHTLAAGLEISQPVRAAVVAASVPAALASLEQLREHLQSSQQSLHLPGLWFHSAGAPPRIGLLFPGQAAPVRTTAGLWGQRFPSLAALHQAADLPCLDDPRATELAQPAILASSLLGLEMLHQLRIVATTAIGHSLGELAALHWGGALDAATLLQLARQRGRLMQTHASEPGTMASLDADAATVAALLRASSGTQTPAAVAGLNGSRQTVIAGTAAAVTDVIERARQQGLQATVLPVSQAFHSPLMAPVVPPLREVLESLPFSPLQQSVFSTVSGRVLALETDLKALLLEQITRPVQFLPALQQADGEVDLWLEVGPGQILSRLARQAGSSPCVALDSGGSSLAGLFEAVAAVFTLGGALDLAPLFDHRFHRPLALLQPLRFFQNPCELAADHVSDLPPLPQTAPSEEDPAAPAEAASIPPSSDQAAPTPLESLRQLVAQRTELPLASIADDHRFLRDLHLNSITVGQLVSQAAQHLGLQAPADPTAFADASLAEVAAALTDLRNLAPQPVDEPFPAGATPWVRAFVWDWHHEDARERAVPPGAAVPSAGTWEVLNLTTDPLPEAFQGSCWPSPPGRGLLVILPRERSEAALTGLLAAGQRVLADDSIETFVLLHAGWGAGFAKSLALEHPRLTTLVLEIRRDHPRLVEWLALECARANGFAEVRYSDEGQRLVPRLMPFSRRLEASSQAPSPPAPAEGRPAGLSSSDCLLVSGGGKGIAAECALALAVPSGCRLVLVGRSDPAEDRELAANLERFRSHGVEPHYFRCDVCSRSEVQAMLEKAAAAVGPITVLLHGAGVNVPKLIAQLTPADLAHTLAPKVNGLKNLLEGIPGDQLNQVITFGSIIARSGLPGEADYALANEALEPILRDFQQGNPHCHCLNLEWSVWSGTGMGERLGRIELLQRRGIQPITPDQGIQLLLQLIKQSLPGGPSLVVSSRFGSMPTIRQAAQELPLLRFLERPRVFYPGIELVVDVALSLGTDPYLRDHVFQGEAIFPGVMGLEAMAQVAECLEPGAPLVEISSVRFHRPIVVPAADPLTIRIAATAQDASHIEVVIRSAQTGFGIDHFQAVYRYGPPAPQQPLPELGPLTPGGLDINAHLYGQLLFHQGRFQRIQSYPHLRATSCIVDLQTDNLTPWFSDFLPPTLVCGDPGARDGAIHALQACVPHRTILPVGLDHLHLFARDDQQPHRVTAIERSHGGDQFVYDLWITSASGDLLEWWQGLTLQGLAPIAPRSPWAALLLPPYLERCLHEAHPHASVAIALANDASQPPRERSDRLFWQWGEGCPAPTRRPDGKPDPIAQQPVSASHCGPLTMAVTQPPPHPTAPHGSAPIACDLERVRSSPRQPWQELLGAEGFNLAQLIALEAGEALEVAATRIWSARECMKKAGLPSPTSLTLIRQESPLVWLHTHTAPSLEASQSIAIATWAVTTQESPDPLVISILSGVVPERTALPSL